MALNKPRRKGEGQRKNGVRLAVLLSFWNLNPRGITPLILRILRVVNSARKYIDKNSSNPKDLFTATKKLLKHDHDVPFPPSDNELTLANEMGTYFIDKIRTIHAKLDKLTSVLLEVSSDDTESCSGVLMDHFKPLSEGDVRKLIEGFPKKVVLWIP